MFIAGRVFPLVILLILSAVILWEINVTRKGKDVKVRRIAGLEALTEVVGRATETGRPVHFTTGLGSIEGGDSTARVLGGLEVMSHVAGRCAQYNTKLVVTVCQPSTYAVTREIVKNSYTQVGHPEMFDDNIVRFLSPEQFAYASSAMEIIQTEKVAGNLLVGSFGAEALLMAEAGNSVGAIQVAGDTNVYQIPFFVVACDYTLIAEEMFASGAVLANNRDTLGGLSGQDLGKAVALGLIVIGTISSMMNNTWLVNLMSR